jgi:hypothetical protein
MNPATFIQHQTTEWSHCAGMSTGANGVDYGIGNFKEAGR